LSIIKLKKSGFTIVEVLVSITIVTIIMTVILFNYGSFTDKLALSSAAQELAVTLRQAQTYGLSVKEVASSPGNFDSAYGVYFDLADQSKYYLFADVVPNKMYGVGNGCGGNATECVQQFTLRNGIRITGLCSDTLCTPASGANFNALSVSFLRPNPDASLYFTNSGVFFSSPVRGKVVLTSPQGVVATVTIESTGQVLVQ